ncbi:hypothetical protein [Gimesia aquarii]|uniref:Uncharacterized protein n=1 Tax=Gimesia aquarii TaxID=2527964 RepID=A0A517X2S4_9PLAN|nr:hypothetical protein [Gimesia aquarii]QDU11813.1 hypothetical protein V202x_52380 [Gimesia aquarii]
MRNLFLKSMVFVMALSLAVNFTCADAAKDQEIKDLKAKIKQLNAKLNDKNNENTIEILKNATAEQLEELKGEWQEASVATKKAKAEQKKSREALKSVFDKSKAIFENEITSEEAKKLDLEEAENRLEKFIKEEADILNPSEDKLLKNLLEAVKKTIAVEKILEAKKATEANKKAAYDELLNSVKAIEKTNEDRDSTLSVPDSPSKENELAALNKTVIDLYNAHRDVIQLDPQNDKKTIPFLVKLYSDLLESSKGIDSNQKIRKLSEDLITKRNAFFKKMARPGIAIKIAGKPNTSSFARINASKKWESLFKTVDKDLSVIEQQGNIKQTRLAYDAIRNGLINRQKYETARNLGTGNVTRIQSTTSTSSTNVINQLQGLYPNRLPDTNNAHSLKRALKYRRKVLQYRRKLQKLPQQ